MLRNPPKFTGEFSRYEFEEDEGRRNERYYFYMNTIASNRIDWIGLEWVVKYTCKKKLFASPEEQPVLIVDFEFKPSTELRELVAEMLYRKLQV